MPNPWEKYQGPWSKYGSSETEDLSGVQSGTKTSQNSLPWSQVPGQALSNIPSSLGNMVGGIYAFGKNAIDNPLQTAQAVGNVILGAGMAAPPFFAGENVTPHGQAFTHFGRGILDRYGSEDALKNTLATDPVGAAADASVVLGGVGALKSAPGFLGKVGGAAKTASTLTDPLAGPMRVAGKMIPKGLPARMYDQALRQPANVEIGQRAANVATGLREGIPLTKGGLQTIRSRMDDVTDQIDAKIAQAGTAGHSVDLTTVLQPVEDLKKFWGQSAGGAEYAKKIDDFINAELSTGSLARYNSGQIPIEVAQQFKRNTNAIINESYGELAAIDKEMKKAMVFGVKDEIAKQFPEVAKLNARDSDLIRLDKWVEKAVIREANYPHFNIQDFARGGGIGAATGSRLAGAITTVYSRVMRSPGFKSHLAIVLNKARKGSNIPPFISRSAVTSRLAPSQPFNGDPNGNQ